MKKEQKRMAVFLFLLLLLGGSSSILAGETAQDEVNTLVGKQLDFMDIGGLDHSLTQIAEEDENPLLENFSLKGVIESFVAGEGDLSVAGIVSAVSNIIFGEIHIQLLFIQKIMMIAIISAMLKNMNSGFYGKEVSELGFYICYLVLVLLIVSSFKTGADLVGGGVEQMVEAMEAVMPVAATLLLAGGNYSQLAVSGPVILGAAGILSSAINSFILPAITMGALLQLINCISERSILTNLTNLIKSAIGYGLKGFSMGFLLIVSLQRMGFTGFNKLLGKTAKSLVGVVPVVGDVMQGAVEVAASLSGAVKNGVAAAFILFLVLLIAVPLIKLAVMIFIYRLTAAALEPVCEARLVKCISGAGDFSVLLFSTLFTVGFMFVFAVIVLLGTTG